MRGQVPHPAMPSVVVRVALQAQSEIEGIQVGFSLGRSGSSVSGTASGTVPRAPGWLPPARVRTDRPSRWILLRASLRSLLRAPPYLPLPPSWQYPHLIPSSFDANQPTNFPPAYNYPPIAQTKVINWKTSLAILRREHPGERTPRITIFFSRSKTVFLVFHDRSPLLVGNTLPEKSFFCQEFFP